MTATPFDPLDGAERGTARPAQAASIVFDGVERSPEHAQRLDNRKKANGVGTLRTVRVAEIEAKPIDWLWMSRLARGKLTLIAGDPGIGKSQIIVDIVARITTGERWPDGDIAPAGNVIMLSAEDAVKDVLRPRLEVAGADLLAFTSSRPPSRAAARSGPSTLLPTSNVCGP
jgi:hypothetical protein